MKTKTRMKSLAYFEEVADLLRASAIDYRLMKRADLIGYLIKAYRKECGLPWEHTKSLYDNYFNKYHN